MQKSLEGDQDDTELITIRHKMQGKKVGRKKGKEGRQSFYGLQRRGNLRRNGINVAEIPYRRST